MLLLCEEFVIIVSKYIIVSSGYLCYSLWSKNNTLQESVSLRSSIAYSIAHFLSRWNGKMELGYGFFEKSV